MKNKYEKAQENKNQYWVEAIYPDRAVSFMYEKEELLVPFVATDGQNEYPLQMNYSLRQELGVRSYIANDDFGDSLTPAQRRVIVLQFMKSRNFRNEQAELNALVQKLSVKKQVTSVEILSQKIEPKLTNLSFSVAVELEEGDVHVGNVVFHDKAYKKFYMTGITSPYIGFKKDIADRVKEMAKLVFLLQS